MAQPTLLCLRKLDPQLLVRTILRVSSTEARRRVREGGWVITSKGAWKGAGRKYADRVLSRPSRSPGHSRED